MNKRLRYIINLSAIPVVLFLFFMFTAKGFGLHSAAVIVNQTMLPTAMGLGLCACLLAGMVDLSIGVKVVLGAVVGGTLAKDFGLPGLIVGCFVGALAGASVQAVLYRFLRIPAMILSVGIIMLYEVIAALIGGAAAHVRVASDIGAFGSYPNNILIMAVASLFFYLMFYCTKVGCHIKAVGNDEKLCKSMGINADSVKFKSYLLSSVMCGFAAILVICYSGTVSVPTGTSTLTMVFKPIMGALIGMQLVKVYDNLPLLVFIGELAIQIIFNGFIALGLSDAWQNMMLGLFILVVMYLTGTEAPTFERLRRIFDRRAA